MPAAPRSLMLLFFGSILSSNAQTVDIHSLDASVDPFKTVALDYSENVSFASNRPLNRTFLLPKVGKTLADPIKTEPVYLTQDSVTLEDIRIKSREDESVIDLSPLKETSVYRKADRVRLQVSTDKAANLQDGLAEISAAYRKPAIKSEEPDCEAITLSVAHRIKVDVSKVLEIVESEVSANPNCACEIVKIAIQESEADIELTADITEVAIVAAPDHMRLISQCAIAAMPEALAAIQDVLARYDANSGDSYSAKDSKSGKSGKDGVASQITPPPAPPNPLDLPSYFPIIPIFPNGPPVIEVTTPNP
ncbi:MAG: hypothetical protein AB8D78_14425 [Akkermansiaceae bacterium]